MAYKDPEVGREYKRHYHQEHKKEHNEKSKQYYWGNRERSLEVSNIWRKSHPKERREYQRAYRDRIKVEVLEHYSIGTVPQCAHCGLDDVDVLTIDHINGNGTKHRNSLGLLGGGTFYLWLKMNNYPEGYQVLCFNCNFKKEMVRRKNG